MTKMQWFYGAGCVCKANTRFKMHGKETLNLKYCTFYHPDSGIRLKVSARSTCQVLVQISASFNISPSVHMRWQEAICKPDSLLCDEKSDVSLTEQGNTWRNSNPRVSLTCLLHVWRLCISVRGEQQAAAPPHYQDPVCWPLLLWLSKSFFFIYWCVCHPRWLSGGHSCSSDLSITCDHDWNQQTLRQETDRWNK